MTVEDRLCNKCYQYFKTEDVDMFLCASCRPINKPLQKLQPQTPEQQPIQQPQEKTIISQTIKPQLPPIQPRPFMQQFRTIPLIQQTSIPRPQIQQTIKQPVKKKDLIISFRASPELYKQLKSIKNYSRYIITAINYYQKEEQLNDD